MIKYVFSIYEVVLLSDTVIRLQTKLNSLGWFQRYNKCASWKFMNIFMKKFHEKYFMKFHETFFMKKILQMFMKFHEISSTWVLWNISWNVMKFGFDRVDLQIKWHELVGSSVGCSRWYFHRIWLYIYTVETGYKKVVGTHFFTFLYPVFTISG
jgi:hypothetical protein